MTALKGEVTGENSIAVTATATGGGSVGIYGQGDAVGVRGDGKTWHGVTGISESTTGGAGVMGQGTATGVIGKGETWIGVYGETQSTTGGSGVWGEHKANGAGVVGKSQGGAGVWAVSETGEGVHAETKSPTVAAIAGFNLNPNGTGAAIYAKKAGTKGHAGFFIGNVHVTGNLTADGDILLSGADCAEDFDIAQADSVEPGTVMVIGEDGALHPSQHAYDKRVAGVISGAGAYKAGIVLDKQDSQPDRKPVALLGKVYCKVDASYSSIEVGDLLTTAPTPGYAMKVTDPLRAFGAVIGKALRPLRDGQSLVPILIALQ